MNRHSPEAPIPEQLSYLERLQKPKNLQLIPLKSNYEASNMRQMMNWAEVIVSTDFQVKLTSSAQEIRDDDGVLLGFYFPDTDVITIDHHINVPEMARQISATNLMIRLVRMLHDKKSVARASFLEMINRKKFSLLENPMVINHTDLDSVLSSLIGTGVLSADELAYGTRAIYADHTGEADELTDLLMAVDPERDFDLSLEVINRWRHGEEQTSRVQELYQKRLQQREIAQNLAGAMKDIGNGVYFAQLTGRIRFSGDLMVPGQPEATALVLAQPINPETKIPGGVDPKNFEIKIRAGMQFPEGASLLQVPFPPEWNVNGRFNAMNTTRAGGFPHRDENTGVENDPIMVAEAIRDYLENYYG